jgi:hypothetical protein
MNAKIVLAVALAIAAPATAYASPFDATQVVEGHTVFVNLSPEGSDLAAIAGSVQCQVLWFNDEVLFRVPAGTSGLCGDARFVYAYASNAPDPRGNPTLRPTGQVWDFVDPNGAPWHVVEYGYKQVSVVVNQNLGLPDFIAENITLEQLDYTTWIVEAGPPIHEPTLKADYNFVLLVDTSKILLTKDDGVMHDGTPGNRAGGNSHDATDLDEEHRFPHYHDASWVTLSLGDAPPLWW